MKTNCINKLLKAHEFNTKLDKSDLFKDKIYYALGCENEKKWIANIVPSELLSLNLKQAIELIVRTGKDTSITDFDCDIQSPDYKDNWGRFANYIELNNRAIGYMQGNNCCCGIINTIKLLSAIPPSAKSWANCIVLSQIFPNIYGDGYNKAPWEENSIYGIKLNCGYSRNIIDYGISDKISAEEQLMAFNNLAHFRNIKTGFRTVISADQIKISYKDKEEAFSWDNPQHLEIYIQESTKLMNLGFEAMFIDSAKHIGNYDLKHYTGVGALPGYSQMQYILHEIRKRSGKTTIAFIGEKSTDDFKRYENMGLNVGTDYINGDDFFKIRELSEKMRFNRNYAPAVEVENDNYQGGMSYEQRLNRISNALFGYYYPQDKLPSFMQTNDIFPLRYDTNTHHIMMSNPSYSSDGTIESHIENLFAKEDGRNYNHKLGVLFAYALCR